jgi:hypothetical protein
VKLVIWSVSAMLLALPTLQQPAVPVPEDDPAPAPEAVSRFLARREPPVASAIALRHLEASTRGGKMRGWIDACTALEGETLRYWIVAEGGSGAVRKRALIAALEGEKKARKETGSRAALDPANYEFAPEIAEEGLLRVDMFLSPDGADLVRIEGRLVKPPSFWTRQVRVVRRYARTAGVRVPVSMESTAKVLVVGTSTFAMTYRYFSINGESVPQELVHGPDTQVCADTPAEGAR